MIRMNLVNNKKETYMAVKTQRMPMKRGIGNGAEFDVTVVSISPPNFRTATFEIKGSDNVPLVINRFSKRDLESNRPKGVKAAKSKLTPNQQYEQARYISVKGWDGFPASMIRNAMIHACRLTDAKMVNAKLAIWVIADAPDKFEPQLGLVRIIGDPVHQFDMARNKMGGAVECHRPAYYDWKAKLMIRWDADQFSLQSIANLLHRAGAQVGIGVGRNGSKMSNGMGWGEFEIEGQDDNES
jgi:hypothetical protein